MKLKKLLLCLAALPMAFVMSQTVEESKAVASGFLIDSADYTGTLVPSTMTYGNGYVCVPKTQSENNWFAAYGNAMGSYKKMTDGDSSHNGNRWDGTAQYNNLCWREEFGPDGGSDAIAVWRAPFNGSVTFAGRMYKADLTGSDGVKISVVNKKSRLVASTEVASKTYTVAFTSIIDTTVDVVSGEMYFFSVNQNGSSAYDQVKVNIKATFTKDTENPGTETTGVDIEPANIETEGFLIEQANYGGSLVPGNMTCANGYVAVPTTQGENNWFAAYGKAMSKYQKMTDQDTSHVGNLWKGSAEYNGMWWREDFGPDGGDDAIAVWRAPFNGKVKFEGRIYKESVTAPFDGVKISVVDKKSRDDIATEIIVKECTAAFSLIIDKEVDVVSGEMYLFSVNQNILPNNDSTKVNIKATFTKDTENPGTETTGTDIEPTNIETDGFLIEKAKYGGSLIYNDLTVENGYNATPNSTQGDNNWFAVYGDAMKIYAKMQYGDATSGANYWQGSGKYNNIWWKQEFGPDGDDAIACWRAPFNGTVHFEGRIFKGEFNPDCDGVKISVVNKKSRTVASTKEIEKTCTEEFAFIVDKQVSVVSGEMYFFSVNQNGTSAYDQTKVYIKATFTKDTENPGTETTGTDIEPMIDPGTTSFLTEEQHYVLGPENQYYAAPENEQGENNFYVVRGDATKKYYYMKPFEEGGETQWKGSNQYNTIWWRSEFYPDGDDVMLLWMAPYNGTVKFEGKVTKTDFTGSDGVKIMAHHKENGSAVPTELVNKEYTDAFTLYFSGATYNVKAGEIFIVSINQLGTSAYDMVKVLCKPTYVKNEVDPGTKAENTGALTDDIDYLSYFGTTQGKNDWFYSYGTMDKKVLMSYECSRNSHQYQWCGYEDWAGISAGNMTPGNLYAVMRSFVCRYTGTISLRGLAEKNSPGGTGANVSFYLNKTILKTALLTDDNNQLDLDGQFDELAVTAGDVITFYVDSGTNKSNDCDNITFKAEIKYLTQQPGTEITNLQEKLAPVTRADLLGVIVLDPVLDQNEDYFASNKNQGLIIGLICGGAALVIAAGVVATTIIIKRRKANVEK